MGDEISLRIADQTLRFRASDDVSLFLHHSHAPFRVPVDAVPDCDVRWTIGEIHASPAPVVGRFEDRWELRALGGGLEEITFYSVVGDDPRRRPTMQIVADAEFTSVWIRQAPRGGGETLAYVSEYPWAEYILQRRLGLHGGAILHASMAIWGSVAHVFLGHSGAGKSTIAELAEELGGFITTDDRTIVTCGPEGVAAWGSPWHGSFPRTSPRGARIGTISLLIQDSVDRLDPIEPGRAVKEMFVRTVQARITEREVQTTLDTLEQVANSVQFFELRFRPTRAAVRLILSAADQAEMARPRGDAPVPQGFGQLE